MGTVLPFFPPNNSHLIYFFSFFAGLESSSNTLTSHPLKEPLRTIENGVHTLDDTKHEHPLRHHFSINRAKNDDGDEHHNLVVSYENSIVNEYSEYYWVIF